MSGLKLKVSDWPFALKVALGPLIAIILLIFVVFRANDQIDSQKMMTDQIVEQQFSKSVEISLISGRLRDINSNLYRLMSLKGAEVEDLDVDSQIEILGSDVTTLVSDLEKFRDRYLKGDEAVSFTNAITEVITYGETIEVVGMNLSFDIASAVDSLKAFEVNFNNLTKRLTQIVETTVSQARNNGKIAANNADEAKTVFGILGFIAVTSVILVSFYIGSNVVRSIRLIADSTKQLAEDKTDIDIDALARGDELGGVVESLRVFRTNIEQRIAMQAEQEQLRSEQERMAAEQQVAEIKAAEEEATRTSLMRQEAEVRRQETMNELADQFDLTVTSSLDTAEISTNEVAQHADGVQGRATQNKSISTDLKHLADNVSSNMQTVASATEELTSSITEIAKQVTSANTVSSNAVKEAGNSQDQITTLSQAVGRIDDFLGLINDIAEQTNLLALNATIEAARAGDAGRGFAVVASEVKGLAAQTASATTKIAEQIKGIQDATSGAVGSIEQVLKIIQQVDDISTGIAGAVEEQSATTQEISRSIQEANSGVSSLNTTVEEVYDMADANSDAAETLQKTTKTLGEVVSTLKGEALRFVNEVRS